MLLQKLACCSQVYFIYIPTHFLLSTTQDYFKRNPRYSSLILLRFVFVWIENKLVLYLQITDMPPSVFHPTKAAPLSHFFFSLQLLCLETLVHLSCRTMLLKLETCIGSHIGKLVVNMQILFQQVWEGISVSMSKKLTSDAYVVDLWATLKVARMSFPYNRFYWLHPMM